MKILVAEDHPTNRNVVSLILELFGIDLTTVEDDCQAGRGLWSARPTI